MENNIKNEFIFYILILIVLIIVVVCNNMFWKIGRQSTEINEEIKDNTTYFEVNNVIYNVPYEEVWLD